MRQRAVSRFVWLVFLCPAVFGQTTGNIEGRVTDVTGAPLPGVSVEAASVSLQGTRISRSARDGSYRLPAVSPGSYRVRASVDGFRSAEKNAVVSLDATATVDLSLEPAAVESVVVSGDVPLIDVTSTTTGTVYTSKVIAHLPVSRNYADIVRSNPGVEPDRGDTQGRSTALAIYGATSAENQWFIDGINTTNVLKGGQGKAINTEFVQEVEVKTGGYQAEYGRALGGIINVITKSGGNQFRGDAFSYYDSSASSAARRITSEDSLISDMRIAEYRRTDYGADLGGFLLKDRLWFFAAYDRVDLPAKVSRFVASPLVSTDERFPLDATDNLYSGKLTWNMATGSTLVATVFADPSTNSGAGGADPRQGFGAFRVPPITNPDPTTWQSTRHVGATDYGLRGSQLFGSFGLLVLQASRHQDRYELEASDLVRTQDFTCQGGTPESPCSPPPVENFVSGGYGQVFGPSNRSLSRRDQIRADLNLYSGAHEIKVGGDYQDGKSTAISSFSGGQLIVRRNEHGTVYYEHEFYAKSFDDLTPADSWTGSPRTRDLGLYVQDSWKPAPGWTINAGLRWDQEDIRDYRDVTVLKTSGEWQPRLGIVWDPSNTGKAKVYASAGRFYYSLPTDLAVRAFGNSIFANTFNYDPVGVTQDSTVPEQPESRAFGGPFGDPVDAGIKGIYQDEFTIGIERLLGPSLSVGVKATYRRLGNAIEDRCDLDYSAPVNNGSNCGIMNPGSSGKIASGRVPGCTGLEPFPGDCTETIPATPPARRLYRGIELVVRKSVAEKAWLQASYVYSSLRGNYDGEISEALFGQTDPGINNDFDYPALYHNSYGRLFLDRPHRLRLDGYYTTPFQLSVGLQAFVRSGSPLNKYGYLNGFSEFSYSPVQLVPKGYAGRLPTEWEANLTLSYPILIGPVTATLQAYVYNLFNNQIATSRDTVWSNSPPADYPASLFDPNQPQSNPEYGKITSRQEPRVFRGAVKISF
jgi:TonB dependent receptor/Carboxypeptidase regulatory-like domain/TonB-dependent Receptor Plug Domain